MVPKATCSHSDNNFFFSDESVTVFYPASTRTKKKGREEKNLFFSIFQGSKLHYCFTEIDEMTSTRYK